MNTKFAVAAVIFVSSAPVLRCQDPKSGAENMKYSRDSYSKVHMALKDEIDKIMASVHLEE